MMIKTFVWMSLVAMLLGCGGGGGGSGGSGLSVNLNCDVADVDYNGDVVLSWSSSNTVACTASGAWSGDKPISGSETIPTLIADSSFTLTCTDAAGKSASDTETVTVGPSGPGTASLSWTPPTTNTDMTPLTDLAGYKILYGQTAGSYDHTVEVKLGDDALVDLGNGRVGFVLDGLAAGTWHFSVRAVDTSFNESELSNTASKEILPQ